jgi:bacillithiol system protein YtxJ
MPNDDMKTKGLETLQDVPSLDAAIAESRERPVLLFKHSRHCGTSFEALDELQSHIDGRATGGVSYKMITVQTHRPVSDAAAQRLGVRHETPQAILLRDGKAVWNASHFRITASHLDQMLPE